MTKQTTKETMTVRTHDDLSFEAYIARPAAAKAPAVIVIQEIFGINAWIRSVADWLAEQGFLAVAPDLFHRLEPGLQLSDQNEQELQKAFALYGQFDENLGVQDITATISATEKLDQCNGKVGTIGFCLGGKLAFLCATRSPAQANVSYYGVGIEKNLQEPVKQNLLLHIAGADSFVNEAAQAQIKDTYKNNPLVALNIYEGQEHAFARAGGDNYNNTAAEQAHKRTILFLREKLGT